MVNAFSIWTRKQCVTDMFHRHVCCEAVGLGLGGENHISHINAREGALMVNTTAKAIVLHSRTESLATFAHWRRAVMR